MTDGNRSRLQSGFSAPELLVVMAVATIATAIAVPTVNVTLNQFDLVLTAQQIASEMQYARMRAVSSNEVFRVRFVGDGRTYQVELENGTVHAGPFQLPRRVLLNVADGGDPVSFPGDEVLFLPTGSLPLGGTGSAGSVRLMTRDGLRVDVAVDGSGMVRVSPTRSGHAAAY